MFATSPHFSAVAYQTYWMLPHEKNLDNSLLELCNHELALLTNTITDTTTTKWWEGCFQSWYFSHLQWFILIWQCFDFVSVLFIRRDLQLSWKDMNVNFFTYLVVNLKWDYLCKIILQKVLFSSMTLLYTLIWGDKKTVFKKVVKFTFTPTKNILFFSF